MQVPGGHLQPPVQKLAATNIYLLREGEDECKSIPVAFPNFLQTHLESGFLRAATENRTHRNASARWALAATSSKTGFYYNRKTAAGTICLRPKNIYFSSPASSDHRSWRCSHGWLHAEAAQRREKRSARRYRLPGRWAADPGQRPAHRRCRSRCRLRERHR